MILAGHQPEYLPYLGFFYKMTQCDKFILVDHVQFARKDFQNRNYIRSNAGKLLLTVPVFSKGQFTQKINQVLINNMEPWARKHWKAMHLNYQSCPFFSAHKDFFADLYAKQWERLVDLNISIIRYLAECFGIKQEILLSSDYNVSGQKTEMLIDMCLKLDADTYVSGQGAKTYVDTAQLREHQLKHRFVKFVSPHYKQQHEPFIPSLSAVDLLFNCGPEAKMVLSEACRFSSVEYGE